MCTEVERSSDWKTFRNEAKRCQGPETHRARQEPQGSFPTMTSWQSLNLQPPVFSPETPRTGRPS